MASHASETAAHPTTHGETKDVDETSFWACICSRHVWSGREEPVLQRTVKHTIKEHVWGCFCEQEFGSLCVFTGNSTPKGLYDCISHACYLLPRSFLVKIQMSGSYRKITTSSIAAASAHAGNSVMTMDWRSQSPDPNPNENI